MGSHSSQAHGNCVNILNNRSTTVPLQQRLQTQNDQLEHTYAFFENYNFFTKRLRV